MQNEFPKVKYHPVHGAVTLRTPEQEAQLGEGWSDAPVPAPAETPAEPPACESCQALRADVEALRAQVAELTLENTSLKEAAAKKPGRRSKDTPQE